MPSIHRILVAIKDPTARTSPALEKAAQLAKTTGAVIELFHAIGEPVALDFELQETSLEEVRQTRKAAVCQRLEKLAQRSRHASGLPIKTAAEWDFPPHEAIVRRAQAIRANLIVADRHPGSARFPWLMRLTDWELLRHSPVPVLLVRNKRPYERAPVLAAVDPSHAHAKPSKLDEEILRTASIVATALRSSLHVVHAFVPMPTDATPSEILSNEAVEALHARAQKQAQAQLETLLKKHSVPRARRHLLAQYPVKAIPMTARKVKADLVVMGAVSRSGLKRLFIGNTAENLINELGCDILIVKPPKFASGVPRAPRGMQFLNPQPPMGFV